LQSNSGKPAPASVQSDKIDNTVTPKMFVCVALAAMMPPAFGADKPETPHLAFVTEYVRELGAIETIRAAGEQEQAAGKQDEAFSNAIHTCTAFQLELGSQIRILKDMLLKPPFDDLTKNLAGFYAQKMELYQSMIDISTAFMGGPKPGVDYDKMSAEMPKIRAALEFVDRAIFEATPLIFATLINQRADSKNHASHLIITKAERTKLLDDIAARFGSKLDQKGQNFTVSAASVLKGYLFKDFKCSDEPWE
jgi:hypothetical protein